MNLDLYGYNDLFFHFLIFLFKKKNQAYVQIYIYRLVYLGTLVIGGGEL